MVGGVPRSGWLGSGRGKHGFSAARPVWGSLLIDPAGDVLVRLTDAGFVWFNNYANFTGSITIGQGHAGRGRVPGVC